MPKRRPCACVDSAVVGQLIVRAVYRDVVVPVLLSMIHPEQCDCAVEYLIWPPQQCIHSPWDRSFFGAHCTRFQLTVLKNEHGPSRLPSVQCDIRFLSRHDREPEPTLGCGVGHCTGSVV